jgi:hypothetical protein
MKRMEQIRKWFRRLFSSPPYVYHRQRLEHHQDPEDPQEDHQRLARAAPPGV